MWNREIKKVSVKELKKEYNSSWFLCVVFFILGMSSFIFGFYTLHTLPLLGGGLYLFLSIFLYIDMGVGLIQLEIREMKR